MSIIIDGKTVESITTGGKTVYAIIDPDRNLIFGQYYFPKNYIQSTGTQWINTGVPKPTATTTVTAILDVQPTASSISSRQVYTTWGVVGNNSSVDGTDIILQNGKWCVEDGGAGTISATSDRTQVKGVFSLSNGYPKGIVYVNVSGTWTQSGSKTRTNQKTYVNTFTLLGGSGTNIMAKSKLYAAQYYVGDTLVSNLIPCVLAANIPASKDSRSTARTAGTVGMWDTVTDKFYGNSGTGTFVAG